MEHPLPARTLVQTVALYLVQPVANLQVMMERIIVRIRVLLEELFQDRLVINTHRMTERIIAHIHALLEEPFQGLHVR